eukprot:CAMPEP_0182417128 /NCGR_PEP_ID=MMETSP1167-20130531/1538_1 /TAXON_ID=2988 /ORGANISM="Mallomonas Sp, Strain CCMP3275" /LENGTH=116 /DNA_ID=CAMNT_0024590449 /DNA_START=151 /DNA_END=501 /DNA_ORIENTATION=+
MICDPYFLSRLVLIEPKEGPEEGPEVFNPNFVEARKLDTDRLEDDIGPAFDGREEETEEEEREREGGLSALLPDLPDLDNENLEEEEDEREREGEGEEEREEEEEEEEEEMNLVLN